MQTTSIYIVYRVQAIMKLFGKIMTWHFALLLPSLTMHAFVCQLHSISTMLSHSLNCDWLTPPNWNVLADCEHRRISLKPTVLFTQKQQIQWNQTVLPNYWLGNGNLIRLDWIVWPPIFRQPTVCLSTAFILKSKHHENCARIFELILYRSCLKLFIDFSNHLGETCFYCVHGSVLKWICLSNKRTSKQKTFNWKIYPSRKLIKPQHKQLIIFFLFILGNGLFHFFFIICCPLFAVQTWTACE